MSTHVTLHAVVLNNSLTELNKLVRLSIHIVLWRIVRAIQPLAATSTQIDIVCGKGKTRQNLNVSIYISNILIVNVI